MVTQKANPNAILDSKSTQIRPLNLALNLSSDRVFYPFYLIGGRGGWGINIPPYIHCWNYFKLFKFITIKKSAKTKIKKIYN